MFRFSVYKSFRILFPVKSCLTLRMNGWGKVYTNPYHCQDEGRGREQLIRLPNFTLVAAPGLKLNFDSTTVTFPGWEVKKNPTKQKTSWEWILRKPYSKSKLKIIRKMWDEFSPLLKSSLLWFYVTISQPRTVKPYDRIKW